MDINSLQSWPDYWRGKPLLFPTTNVARNFWETRKCRMEELGIIALRGTVGFYIDKTLLDEHLIDLLKTTDGRQAA